MHEDKTTAPIEPKQVGEDLSAYLHLLEESEMRKLELERLQGEMKTLRVLNEQAAAMRAEHVDRATARVVVAETNERATRNKLVVTAQALDALCYCLKRSPIAKIDASIDEQTRTAFVEALELLIILKRENVF